MGISELSSASTATLLIHEKGTKSVRLFSASRSGSGNSTTISFDQYKKIQSSLRNKKGRVEELSDVKLLNLNSQSIHTTINTKLYDLLVVLSKDEFLPFDKSEQDFLNTIKFFSQPILEEMTLKYKKNLTRPLILNTLMSCNIKFLVSNKSDLVIFKNFLDSVSLDEFKRQSTHWRITSSLTLMIQDPDSHQKISDLSQSQRISFLGELLNTLKHELSNPLFGLSLTAQSLQEELKEEKDTIDEVIKSIARASEIIKSFSSLYEENEIFKEVDLKKIIQETITLCKSELKGIRRNLVILDNDKTMLVNSNPIWLSQILFNIIINSAQALNQVHSNNKCIDIRLSSNSEESFTLEITDNGPGMSKEIVKKIFDPFFTTKSNGTGLGLAICKSLCDRLNITLDVESSEGTGTTVRLHLHGGLV